MGKKFQKTHTQREKFSKLTQRDLDRMARSLVDRGLASRLIIDRVFRKPLTDETETGNR